MKADSQSTKKHPFDFNSTKLYGSKKRHKLDRAKRKRYNARVTDRARQFLKDFGLNEKQLGVFTPKAIRVLSEALSTEFRLLAEQTASPQVCEHVKAHIIDAIAVITTEALRDKEKLNVYALQDKFQTVFTSNELARKILTSIATQDDDFIVVDE